jgi:uncharacterized protein YlzI (FlbEa/FlbD family)
MMTIFNPQKNTGMNFLKVIVSLGAEMTLNMAHIIAIDSGDETYCIITMVDDTRIITRHSFQEIMSAIEWAEKINDRAFLVITPAYETYSAAQQKKFMNNHQMYLDELNSRPE